MREGWGLRAGYWLLIGMLGPAVKFLQQILQLVKLQALKLSLIRAREADMKGPLHDRRELLVTYARTFQVGQPIN